MSFCGNQRYPPLVEKARQSLLPLVYESNILKSGNRKSTWPTHRIKVQRVQAFYSFLSEYSQHENASDIQIYAIDICLENALLFSPEHLNSPNNTNQSDKTFLGKPANIEDLVVLYNLAVRIDSPYTRTKTWPSAPLTSVDGPFVKAWSATQTPKRDPHAKQYRLPFSFTPESPFRPFQKSTILSELENTPTSTSIPIDAVCIDIHISTNGNNYESYLSDCEFYIEYAGPFFDPSVHKNHFEKMTLGYGQDTLPPQDTESLSIDLIVDKVVDSLEKAVNPIKALESIKIFEIFDIDMEKKLNPNRQKTPVNPEFFHPERYITCIHDYQSYINQGLKIIDSTVKQVSLTNIVRYTNRFVSGFYILLADNESDSQFIESVSLCYHTIPDKSDIQKLQTWDRIPYSSTGLYYFPNKNGLDYWPFDLQNFEEYCLEIQTSKDVVGCQYHVYVEHWNYLSLFQRTDMSQLTIEMNAFGGCVMLSEYI